MWTNGTFARVTSMKSGRLLAKNAAVNEWNERTLTATCSCNCSSESGIAHEWNGADTQIHTPAQTLGVGRWRKRWTHGEGEQGHRLQGLLETPPPPAPAPPLYHGGRMGGCAVAAVATGGPWDGLVVAGKCLAYFLLKCVLTSQYDKDAKVRPADRARRTVRHKLGWQVKGGGLNKGFGLWAVGCGVVKRWASGQGNNVAGAYNSQEMWQRKSMYKQGRQTTNNEIKRAK